MKTLCSRIKYAFLFEVDSISNDSITLKLGFSLKTLNIIGDANVEESSQDAPQGSLFIQSIKGMAQRKTTDVRNISYYPMIMLISFDDTEQVWGSLENPVRAALIKSVNDVINFEFARRSANAEF